MNTQRGWFLIIGLTVALLLGGGAYFFLTARQSLILAPKSPSGVAQAPVSNPSSAGRLSPLVAPPAPSPQPQSSGPAPAYLYNAQGQLQAITYPDGSVYSYQYDAYGDKIRETNGMGKTWSYVYDQNHHPVRVIDPEGRVTHKEASPNTPHAN
jgi:YD repeat-containing protein